jgi:hypothetical protein
VGYPETGDKLSLGDFKTVGMSAANGDIKWSRPGFFMCGGTLQFLSTAVTCDFSGTVTERTPLQFSGLGRSFQGLDPVSGQVVWSEPVADPEAVAEAVPQPFVDGRTPAVRRRPQQRARVSSCAVTGAPAKGLPSSRPSAVGMDADGLFIWLAPTGLRAVPLG